MSRFDSMAAQWIAKPQNWVHGETISGTPTGIGSTAIQAVVERGELETIGPSGILRNEYRVRIWISRADWPTLTINADTFALKKRITDSSSTTMTAAKLLEDSNTSDWHLELR